MFSMQAQKSNADLVKDLSKLSSHEFVRKYGSPEFKECTCNPATTRDEEESSVRIMADEAIVKHFQEKKWNKSQTIYIADVMAGDLFQTATLMISLVRAGYIVNISLIFANEKLLPQFYQFINQMNSILKKGVITIGGNFTCTDSYLCAAWGKGALQHKLVGDRDKIVTDSKEPGDRYRYLHSAGSDMTVYDHINKKFKKEYDDASSIHGKHPSLIVVIDDIVELRSGYVGVDDRCLWGTETLKNEIKEGDTFDPEMHKKVSRAVWEADLDKYKISERHNAKGNEYFYSDIVKPVKNFFYGTHFLVTLRTSSALDASSRRLLLYCGDIDETIQTNPDFLEFISSQKNTIAIDYTKIVQPIQMQMGFLNLLFSHAIAIMDDSREVLELVLQESEASETEEEIALTVTSPKKIKRKRDDAEVSGSSVEQQPALSYYGPLVYPVYFKPSSHSSMGSSKAAEIVVEDNLNIRFDASPLVKKLRI